MAIQDPVKDFVVGDTQIMPTRGRPRSFDREAALATAQDLFHARGFDGVSLSELTAAIGINPPSFYSAFGSKAALYAETLMRYELHEALDVETALAPGRSLSAGIAALLRLAADSYGSGDCRGCMVIEGARATIDPEAGSAARARLAAARTFIHARIARLDVDNADIATDYVMMALSGLSGSARNGMPLERLRLMAGMAADGLAHQLEKT
jgi:TetR/AcrR family transcriptional repressor for divergent bdcA